MKRRLVHNTRLPSDRQAGADTNMDTLYSISLLLSLVAGALAVLLSVLPRFPRLHRLGPPVLRDAARRNPVLAASIFLAIAALMVSLVVHLGSGHRPGSPEALPFYEFFRIHPAYIIAALLPVLAAILHRLLAPRGEGDGSK